MQSKLHVLLFLCLACLIALPAQAQKTKKKKSNADDVIVILADESERKNAEEQRTHPIIFKISPSAWLVGNFPMEVEYKINDMISINGGIAINFSTVLPRNYSNALFASINDDTDPFSGNPYSTNWAYPADVHNFLDTENTNETIKQKIGLGFNLSPRIYYTGEAMEGYYLSPSFTFSKRRYDTPKVVENNTDGYNFTYSTSDFAEESEARRDFSLRFGRQYISENDITFDAFVGLGARSSVINRLDVGTNIQGDFYRNGIVEYTTKGFLYEIGFRIGYILQ